MYPQKIKPPIEHYKRQRHKMIVKLIVADKDEFKITSPIMTKIFQWMNMTRKDQADPGSNGGKEH